MKLALYDDNRLGVLRGDDHLVDVTGVLPHWDNGYAANFWLRLCHDFAALRPRLEQAALDGPPVALSAVRLLARNWPLVVLLLTIGALFWPTEDVSAGEGLEEDLEVGRKPNSSDDYAPNALRH